MRLPLKLHPDSRCDAVSAIEADLQLSRRSGLDVRYLVSGDVAQVRFPAAVAPRRVDGLWNHTCFELFAQAVPSSAYCEFNFSPSSEWAAYRFESYRSGPSAQSIEPPEIRSSSRPGRYELSAHLKPDGAADSGRRWRIGLSAVIEEISGRLSYWALAHPTGKPDFHHRDCFAVELP